MKYVSKFSYIKKQNTYVNGLGDEIAVDRILISRDKLDKILFYVTQLSINKFSVILGEKPLLLNNILKEK